MLILFNCRYNILLDKRKNFLIIFHIIRDYSYSIYKKNLLNKSLNSDLFTHFLNYYKGSIPQIDIFQYPHFLHIYYQNLKMKV
jgi:hypothetical protein